MSKVKNFSILLLLVLLAFSCSRREDNIYGPGMGGIRIDLATQAPATRAELEDGSLNADDFKVEIINSQGVIFKRWATFSEYKAQESTAVQMNAGGPYTLRATLGDSTASGWNSWFFKGEQQFTVLPQETVEVSVICKMANVKVAVVYGENIRNDYVDYTATVENSRGSLSFDKDCSEAGYLPVGDLDVTLTMTDADGKNWYFKNSSKVEANAGDFITLNLDTKSVPEYGIGIEINIDRTTNDSTVVIELPTYMLPSPEPTVNYDGFDESGNLSSVEGVKTDAKVNFNISEASGGIKSCVMTVTSPLLISRGWPETIDFTNIPANVRTILDRDGLVYSSVQAGNTMASIEFTGMYQILKFSSTDLSKNNHEFHIVLTDETDKTVESNLAIVIQEADKSIAFADGDVWARRLYATLSTSNGDPTLLIPQISVDGQIWTTPSYTETVSGTNKAVIITGLSDNTAYQVRAAYNDNGSETKSFTTEAAAQVSNAGFEEWSTFVLEWNQASLWNNRELEWYRPYSSENLAWWDVNSRSTMIDYTSLAGSQNSRVFFTAAYTIEDPYEGNRSAMVFTTHVWSTEYTATKAGEIFIGRAVNDTPDGDGKGGQHESEGYSFSSRPSAVRFAYKYSPVNNETFYVEIWVKDANGNVIGSATDATGFSASSWESKVINVDYGDNVSVKAASLYILFKSSSSAEPSYNSGVSMKVADNKTYSDCNIGSILYLDDIELIYE